MDNSIMDKIIKVHFESDKYYCYGIQGLVQWDKCQKLEISGLDISDEIVEVHFSLDEVQGNAERMYGTVKDGVIHADIPEFILEGPEYICSGSEVYNAYAWIYVSDEESAETIRKMEFEIKARPKPNGYASPDKQDPFLQEIRQVLTDTKQIAQSVRDDADAGKFNGNASINQEALLQLAIKPTTEKAPFHHITDSANMKVVDFGMEGKTEQNTTSGIQLIPPEAIKKATYNLTAFRTIGYLLEANQTYMVVTSVNADSLSFKDVSNNDNLSVAYGNNNISYTPSEDILAFVDCYFANGVPDGVEIMLYKGSTVLPIEPYTGAQPSPNPDYPQEIVNAGTYNEATGRYEIGCSVVNRNLFNCGNSIPSSLGIVDGNIFKTTAQVNGIFSNLTNAVFEENTQYVVAYSKSISFKDVGIQGIQTQIVYTDGTYDGFYMPERGAFIKTSKVNKTIKCIQSNNPFGAGVEYENMQIYKLTDGDEYIPLQSQPLTLTSPAPLTKWDYKAKRDGLHGWSVWNGEYIFDKDKKYTVGTWGDLVSFSVYNIPSICNRNDAFCESFRFISNPQTLSPQQEGFDWNGTTLILWLHKDRGILDAESFKAYLAENPIKILYHASEEQAFHPLPDNEQALLNNLETYYGVTNLYNDQGCPMWLTYVADTKLYTDQQIAKQIAQTQALILEN